MRYERDREYALQVIDQCYFPAVREILAVDAVSPYLVREHGLVHLNETHFSEKIWHIGEGKYFLDPNFTGLLETCLYQGSTISLSLELLAYRKCPDLGKVIPGDVERGTPLYEFRAVIADIHPEIPDGRVHRME